MSSSRYTYTDLTHDIRTFSAQCPRIPVFSIGKSLGGRSIYALKLGSGPRRIFFSGAYHGTEHLTAKVLVAFAQGLASGEYASHINLDDTSLYIVPMVNPDGIELAAGGVYWQANARGVDINHNFDALWALSKETEAAHGANAPGPTRYGGEYPESEPETKAVADFTRQNNFDMVMALHSQGEVIYYDFCGLIPDGTEEYLEKFESVSRYRRAMPEGIAAYGGYKDWFIKKYKKPGFTVEIGLGENPLPMSDFDEVFSGVLPILLAAANQSAL